MLCCPAGQRFPFSQEKLQSCLKVTLKSIRRISWAWSSRFGFLLTSTIKRKGWILKEGKEISLFPFEGNEGLPSLHGEKRATARPLLLQWSGMCEGATAGTVAPSHLLLKFGKLTIKFEMLCKETKSLQFQKNYRKTQQSKAVLSALLSAAYAKAFLTSVDKRNG